MNPARFPAAFLLAVGLASCVGRSPIQPQPSGVAPTLAISTYYEEGTQAAVVVGVRPALSRRERPYIPLEIGIANKGLASMTVTPESFTLIDAAGHRFPTAGAAELSRSYGSTDADRRLGEVRSLLRPKYLQYDRVPSNFTPGFDAPIQRPQTFLHRFSYFVDMIYFPNPSVPTPDGPYDLLVRVPELPDPLVIRFFIGRPR